MYSVNKIPKDICSSEFQKLTSALQNYSRENSTENLNVAREAQF